MQCTYVVGLQAMHEAAVLQLVWPALNAVSELLPPGQYDLRIRVKTHEVSGGDWVGDKHEAIAMAHPVGHVVHAYVMLLPEPDFKQYLPRPKFALVHCAVVYCAGVRVGRQEG